MAAGTPTIQDVSSFRAFRTSLRDAFADYRSPQLILDVLLGWSTTRVSSVTVAHAARTSGRSNYGYVRLWKTLLLLWTGYTTAPLRLASWLGFVFVLFGIAILGYVSWIYFTQGSLPGFPFLASTIAIFGGVQLFALGIIGEYLARLFDRSLDRPTYAVRQEAAQSNTVRQ
jgi:undecaprenyl-phosphate 4-deoxy-4-formamido-L-arabinose transferase